MVTARQKNLLFFSAGHPVCASAPALDGHFVRYAELALASEVLIILHASRLKHDLEKTATHLMRGLKRLSLATNAERVCAKVMLNQALKRE
jgi:hypothetical protein